jgi:hypothetical protein
VVKKIVMPAVPALLSPGSPQSIPGSLFNKSGKIMPKEPVAIKKELKVRIAFFSPIHGIFRKEKIALLLN